MARLAAAVIQPVSVAPQLERMARDAAVHVRRDGRDGVRRLVPGVARGDSTRKLVPLGTFLLEHDAPPCKSNRELFPTVVQPKQQTGILRQTINSGLLGTCLGRVKMSN
jgi:hypothetical protein